MWRGKTRRAQRKMRTTSGRTWKLQIYKRRSLDRTHDLCLPGKVINISPPWCPVEVQWVRRSTRGTLQRHSSVQALLVKIHGRSFADSWCGGGCGGCGGNRKMQLSSGAYFWGGEGGAQAILNVCFTSPSELQTFVGIQRVLQIRLLQSTVYLQYICTICTRRN